MLNEKIPRAYNLRTRQICENPYLYTTFLIMSYRSKFGLGVRGVKMEIFEMV